MPKKLPLPSHPCTYFEAEVLADTMLDTGLLAPASTVLLCLPGSDLPTGRLQMPNGAYWQFAPAQFRTAPRTVEVPAQAQPAAVAMALQREVVKRQLDLARAMLARVEAEPAPAPDNQRRWLYQGIAQATAASPNAEAMELLSNARLQLGELLLGQFQAASEARRCVESTTFYHLEHFAHTLELHQRAAVPPDVLQAAAVDATSFVSVLVRALQQETPIDRAAVRAIRPRAEALVPYQTRSVGLALELLLTVASLAYFSDDYAAAGRWLRQARAKHRAWRVPEDGVEADRLSIERRLTEIERFVAKAAATQPQEPDPTGPALAAFDYIESEDTIDALVAADPDAWAFDPLEVVDALDDEDAVDEWLDGACDKITTYGARAFLRRLLAELELREEGGLLDLEEEELFDLEEDEPDPETIYTQIMNTVNGARVAQWIERPANMPDHFDGGILFENGFMLPVCTSAGGPRQPAASRLAALPGQHLQALFIFDEDDPPYLILCFSRRAPDDADLAWEEVQTRAFTRVATTVDAASGSTRLTDLNQVWNQIANTVIKMVMDTLGAHLGRKRVAHLEWHANVPHLIFDDEHVLPLLPVSKAPTPTPAQLEAVVGRYLVMAQVDQQTAIPQIHLYYHDDKTRIDDRLFATTTSGPLTGAAAALAEDPETHRLAVDPISVLQLVCPESDVTWPVTR